MTSAWEQPPHGEFTEVEIEARPVQSTRAAPPDEVALAVRTARRGALALRVLAYGIIATSVLGYILLSFWSDEDDGFGGESLRERIGNLLSFIWAPAALAGLVYTAALLVSLYAARIELAARRPDAG